jgi:8-oxo-dGTP diphosphatase
MPLNPTIANYVSNRIRVRVCGLLEMEGGLVLVNHTGLYGHDFWLPPGGGLEFGETTAECLKREFWEECGLKIEPGHFLFACSVINQPIHAIELFFSVKHVDGTIITGHDPERGSEQIISQVRIIPFKELDGIDRKILHPMFREITKTKEILSLKGFFELT